jgi:hypothetical protein
MIINWMNVIKIIIKLFKEIFQNELIRSTRRSFCASPGCRPQLRLGLQSLSLAQKDSLLLLMI